MNCRFPTWNPLAVARFNPHSPLLANEFKGATRHGWGISGLVVTFQSTFAIAGE